MPGVVIHGIALGLTLLVAKTLGALGWRRPRTRSILIFHGYLLIAAMVANGFWSCLVWGRYYWSVDYLVDFSAFMPIFPNQVRGSWGPGYDSALNGISLTQLNA